MARQHSEARISEANLWRVVREALSPFGRLERIENGVGLGTPDVVYCLRRHAKIPQATTGWIELKHVPEWPKRASTPLIIEHLTREQVNFASRWALAGGNYTCLVQVKNEFLFLDHRAVAELFGRQMTRKTLSAVAGVHMIGSFPMSLGLRWLTKSQEIPALL